LVYTVDLTKPFGKRVKITSLADGTPFKQDEWYTVAMTSYRASGGGEILQKGAGLSKEEVDERIQERLPEIREMVYQYFKRHGTVGTQDFGNRAVLGAWYFVPEKLVAPMFEKDLSLIF
jgi:2',3'-cyclic-nucleotide 2'-phosphodiesterase/3'-nucleotidase